MAIQIPRVTRALNILQLEVRQAVRGMPANSIANETAKKMLQQLVSLTNLAHLLDVENGYKGGFTLDDKS